MDLRAAAVAENVSWCALVGRWHGVQGIERDGLALALDAPPPFYPAAITLRRGPTTAERLPRGGAVKDSFADLDLTVVGFVELFAAEWVGRAAPPPRPTPWEVVRTPEQLAAWRAAAGGADAIRDDVLAEPDVVVLGRPGADGMVAGAVAHRDARAGVVGLSNTFGPVDRDELAAAAAERFGGLPLVGYERGDALAAAERGGFDRLGPLRVWVPA